MCLQHITRVHKYERCTSKGGKKVKKLLAIILVVVFAAGMLGGCKAKTEENNSTGSNSDGSNQTSDNGSSTGSTDTASADQGEKRVLTFNCNSFAAPQNVPGLQEAFDKWEKENNATIEISLSTDDYLTKLLQDINAGNVADVAFVDGSNLAEVNKTGKMVSLDKWFTPDLQAQHYKYAIDGSKIDGQIKAVWFHGGLWNLYYRKDLLEAAGYTEPPKDWNELLEMGKKLTVDENGDGVIDRYALGIPAFPDAVTVCTLLPWFWGHGSTANLTNGVDKVAFGEGDSFNAMKDTLGYIKTLIDEKVVSPDIASISFNDVQANFVGGQTAMAILGNWHYPLMKDSGGEDFISKIGITNIPAVPGQESVTTAGGWTIAMFTQDPEQQELAWSFMNFYRSAEVQTLLTKIGQMTSLLEVYQQPEFANDPVWVSYSQGLLGGKTRDSVPFYSAVDLSFQNMVQAVAAGETDIDGLIKSEAEKAQTAADDIMKN
jgi:ABC-type glycerol-3-phosphate transport system substrate-binding protein